MTRDEFLGLLRQLLTLAGGIAVARGRLTQSDFEAYLGMALAAGSALWMLWSKRTAAEQHAEEVQKALYTTPPRDPELDQ